MDESKADRAAQAPIDSFVTKTGHEALAKKRSMDEETDRVGGLRQLGKWATITYGALCVANVWLGEPWWVRAGLFGVWACFWIASEVLLRRGLSEWGAWPLALGGALIIAGQQWLSGGLMSPATGGYVLVVVVSGLMGGMRLCISMTALAVVNAVGLWLAGQYGWLSDPLLAIRDSRSLLQHLAAVGLGALAVALALGRLRKTADLAQSERESAQKLGESFQTLFLKSDAPMGLTEGLPRPGEQLRRGVAANEAFSTLFQINRHEAIEVAGAQMTLWRDKAQLIEVRDELSARGRVDRKKVGMQTYDGKKMLDVLISAVPVNWEGIEAVLWTFQDVTENELMREELEVLNAELAVRVEGKVLELEQARAELERRERLAKLGEMVAGVAHEINTPIGNALLSASTLDEPSRKLLEMSSGATLSRVELAKAARKVAEAASIAVENLGRASDIIKSFKQLSADQTGQTRRHFGLDEVVGGALRMIGPSMKAAGIEWSLDLAPDARAVRIDGYPGALSQIVGAMASNAIEHAYGGRPPGFGKLFKVGVEMAGPDKVRLEFIDNGSGMPSHVAAKVFEPFFTTKAGQGGTGLGLAIAWNLAREALGATLSLAEHGPGGSRFVMEVPLESPRLAPVAKKPLSK